MSTSVSTDLLHLARFYADHADDWPLAPRFDPRQHWFHRLAASPDAEVWLLTWLPGQGTDLHDHGGSAGAFVVLSGVLTEHTVTIRNGHTTLDATSLPAGAGRRFDAHHVHRISNDSDRPAVSVHAYAPMLQTMVRYTLDEGRLSVSTVDRAGVQW